MTEMVRCGVNLVGFDQLHPGDDRLPSLVWSWRTDEPAVDAVGECAALGADARFFADDCAVPRRVACRTANGDWAVTPDAVAWAAGDDACRLAGHVGAAVPVNGWDNSGLREAADLAGVSEVWLAYGQDVAGEWVRGIPPTAQEPETIAPGRSGARPADPKGHGGPPTEPGGPGGPGRGKPVASTRPVSGMPLLVGGLLIAAATLSARRRHA